MQKIFWPFLILMLLAAALLAWFAPAGDNARLMAQIPAVDDAWRAALPRDPEQATAAYLARVPAAALARSDAYFEGGYWLRLWNVLSTIGACLLLLGAQILPRLHARLTRRLPGALATFIASFVFLILLALLQAPLTVYEGFYREHAYGLSNQSFAAWLHEVAMGMLIFSIIGAILLGSLLWLIKRSPQQWWLWGAGACLPLLAFFILLAPVYLDPVFNQYKPLAEGPLRSKILAMARANGVPADNVLQFDASRQSNRISANVSGIGNTAAIRLNDNLLKRCSHPEIEGVMGHELGHYVLNHVYRALLILSLLALLAFAFVHWLARSLLMRYGAAWSVREMAQIGSLPLIMLLISLYGLLTTPLQSSAIRVAEIEADLFGLNAAAQPDGVAEVHLKLLEYRKANPGYWEEVFFYDHPAPRQRIYAAMRWKAEHWPPAVKP
ncbi:M48 family metallopeptidase [Massilia sp. W12]|uniref:M48 family metallopeptidase n=1 Tax=Massilia sp. W12 TaxID=3126507 RepID=UPI0030D00861